MNTFFSGLGTIIGLELRQRVRGAAWYVLLGVFFVLVGLVTLGTITATNLFGDTGAGQTLYSTVIYFVLLLATLVAPALSGNAINGERDAGTLATTQVTLISTGQIILGKFVAAWITALAFLLASVPALVVSLVVGRVPLSTILISLGILAIEVGVVAAIGVGLSGLLTRPILSIVVTYLVVAALSVGSLIAFGLIGLVNASKVTNTYVGLNYDGPIDPETGLPEDLTCMPPIVETYSVPRFDRVWGVLAANPYVILADAAAPAYNAEEVATGNYRNDLFSSIQWAVRSAQIAPPLETGYNECEEQNYEGETQGDIVAKTVPVWWVGLAIHLVLAALALVGAWLKLRTPARKLSTGTRIA